MSRMMRVLIPPNFMNNQATLSQHNPAFEGTMAFAGHT